MDNVFGHTAVEIVAPLWGLFYPLVCLYLQLDLMIWISEYRFPIPTLRNMVSIEQVMHHQVI